MVVNPAPAMADPLGAPAGVTLTPGRRLIKVDWTAPTNPNGTVATYVATASTGESCTVNAPTLTCTITGVAANTNITVGVKACPVDQVDCSVPTQGAGPVRAGPPGTPSAPMVVFNGNPNAVTLSWAAPDPGVGIDSYRITATPSAGLTGSCGSLVLAPTTACDFAGLVDDTSYTFKVTAIGITNGTGTTGTSAAGASSVAKVAGKPHAPAKPTVTRFADDAVVVSWDRPSGNQIISGYTVTADPAAPQVCTSDPDVTECKVTGLVPATSYTFTVVAKGEALDGGSADPSPASDPIVPGMPAKPSTPTVELGALPGAVTVYWDPPTEGGTVTTYLVEADSPNGGTAPTGAPATVAANLTYRDFTGLQNGKQYRFRVTANNAAGNLVSDWSDPIVSQLPDKPATPTVSLGDAEGKVNLSWPANSTGGPVVFYRVTALPATGNQTGTAAAGCGFDLVTPTCTISGLDMTVSYTFKVTAVGDLGSVDSDPSASVLPAKPSAPTVPAVALTNNDATVSWGAPNGGAVVASYTVTAAVADGSAAPSPCTVTVASGNPLQCVFSGLNTAKLYGFSVKSVNAAGTTEVLAVPAAGAVPSQPQTVAAALVSDTPGAVDVTWTAPAVGTATRYVVTAASSDAVPIPADCMVNAPTVTCRFSGLNVAGHYTFVARAENQLGVAAAAATTAIVPNVPAAPTSAAATVTASGAATVTWAASPNTGGEVATYTVTATSPDSGTLPGESPCSVNVAANPSATLSCAFTGMDPTKSYQFTVRAANAAGGTDAAATDPILPAGAGAPTNVQVALVAGPKVTVTWDAPTSSAPVTQYTVIASSADGGTTRTCTVTPPAALTCDFTDLTLTAHYSFVVKAANAVGNTDADAVPGTPFIPDKPGAPGNVAAVRGNAVGKATITWDAPTTGGAVVKYTVTPTSTDAAAVIPANCEVTPPNARSCTFTTLTPSTPYTFAVSATNTAGLSTTTSTPALVPNTPDKPANVVVSVLDPGQVTVTWDAPAGTSAPPTNGWVVTPASADGGATATPATCSRTEMQTRTCTFTDLTLTSSYSFTVQAINEAGSTNSDPTTPLVANKPNQPVPPTAKVIDGATAAVTWTAPVGGGPVTRYTVDAYSAGAPTTTITSAACTDVTTLSCDFGGLVETETYTFRVTAIGPGGSAQSEHSVALVTAGPGKPAAPTVELAGPNAVTVTWTSPSTGGQVLTYTVSSTPDLSAPARCVNVTALACVFDRLVPGTAYTFTVSANGTGERSTASDASTSITIPADPPGVPSAPTVEVLSASSARVTWTTPTGGGPVGTYTVLAYSSGAPDVGLSSTTGCTNVSAHSCAFAGLSETETYTFRVTAIGPGGSTQSDHSVLLSTAGPGKPAAPTVQLAGPNAVTVSWNSAPGSGPVISYTVTSTPDVSAPARCTNVRPPLMTCVFDNLRSGTAYTFAVVANGTVDRTTSSDASTPIVAGPPAAVPAPTVSPAGANAVTVSWATSTTGGQPTGYLVRSDPSSVGCTVTDNVTTSCVVSGLTGTTAYTFQVKALGAAGGGDSPWSPMSEPITPGAPAAPTDVVVSAGNGQIAVSWTAPAVTTGITRYRAEATPGNAFCETTTNTDTECVITDLTNLTFYTVTVTAVGEDVSTVSVPSTRVQPTAGLPGRPTGVKASVSGGQVAVSWVAPISVGNGIGRYIATAVDSAGKRVTCRTPNGTTTSCNLTDLSAGAYWVTVVSVGRSASGFSEPSVAYSLVVKVAPGVPTDVTVTNTIAANSLKVDWKAGAAGDGLAGFLATATLTGGTGTAFTCITTGVVTAETAATCTIANLTPGSYTVTVVARGATGVLNSAASVGVQATALAGLAPEPATSVPSGSPGTLTVSSSTPNVGATITVGGSGFAAYTEVSVVIIGGTSLGTVTTDASGAFTDKQVTLPAGTGAMTLAAVGLPPTGTTLRYQTAALTVAAV